MNVEVPGIHDRFRALTGRLRAKPPLTGPGRPDKFQRYRKHLRDGRVGLTGTYPNKGPHRIIALGIGNSSKFQHREQITAWLPGLKRLQPSDQLAG